MSIGIVILVISFYAGIHFTEKDPNPSALNVKEELDNQFGWGKAEDRINIEAVKIIKGVIRRDYGNYDFPMPAIELAIKNNGQEKLDSFSIICNFSDIDNKVELCTFGDASGLIDPGWTTKRYVFWGYDLDYSKILGKNIPINFKIKAQIYVDTKSAGRILLYETVFKPNELSQLPIVEE